MSQYKVHDVFYQYIHEAGEVPSQELVLIKIIPEQNLYRLKGVQDGLLYDYPKSYLDVFLRKKFPYGS
jgi:hypothetical protein